MPAGAVVDGGDGVSMRAGQNVAESIRVSGGAARNVVLLRERSAVFRAVGMWC